MRATQEKRTRKKKAKLKAVKAKHKRNTTTSNKQRLLRILDYIYTHNSVNTK